MELSIAVCTQHNYIRFEWGVFQEAKEMRIQLVSTQILTYTIKIPNFT